MARSFGGSSGARGGAKAPFSSASYSSGPKSHANGESQTATGRNKKKKKTAKDGSHLMNAMRQLDDKPAKKGKASAVTEESASGKKDTSTKKRRSAADAAIEEANMQGLNVYEYAPDHVKRSRTESSKFELSRDEAAFAGGSSRGGKRGLRGRNPMNDASDDDEDEDGDDMAKRIRKAARMIASEQLMNFDEDEELDGGSEEVDSDAAWNGSEGTDEERWGDAMRVLKKKSSQQTKKSKGKDKVLARSIDRLPTDEESENENDIDIDLSDSDMEETRRPSSGSRSTRPNEGEDADEAKSFKPNLGAFADGDESEDDMSVLDSDEEDESLDEEDGESVAEEFSGFGHGDSSLQEDEEEDESEEDEDEDMIVQEPELPSDAYDSDDETGAGVDLRDFVDSLPGGKKRKVEFEQTDGPGEAVVEADASKKKRRVLPSMKGPGGRDEGSDFGLNPTNKLTLTSLLASDPSLKASATALLKADMASKDSKNGPTSILKQGTLSAPLPTVVTERLAREAAYEQTKAEGDKWGGVMKRIKEAEYLKFPLQIGGTAGAAGQAGSSKERRRGGVKTSGDLVGAFQPTNALESAVTALLESANLQDAQIAKAEEDALQGQDLTVEEITRRRAELRRQRELLFREEARAKRISKIKSKTYRKIARKRAAKNGGGEMDLEDLRRLDPEQAEEEALKMEAARAKERATLKHSAKGGRWARAQYGAGETDGKRREIEEMLSQKERLTRKIQGRDSDASSDDDSEDDDDDEDQDDAAVRGDAFDELQALQEKSRRLEEETAAQKPTGIFGMKFMQRAMAKDKARVDDEEAELRRQLEEYSDAGLESDEEGDSDRDPDAAQSMRVANNPGRMVFSANPTSVKETVAIKKSGPQNGGVDSEDDDVASSLPNLKEPEKASVRPLFQAPAAEEEANPWAELGSTGTGGRARKNNKEVNFKNASAVDKANMALRKQEKSKTREAKNRAADDAAVDIDLDSAALLKGKGKPKNGLALSDGEGSDEDEEFETGPANVPKAFKQRDLVAQAFAGDNVIEDFAAEKQRVMEADAPREEDTTLAGWGSWGGKGVKKNRNAKKFTKVAAGVDAAQRKDAGKANVIINEKKDKKAAKYMLKDLPYPYTSAAQYEASFTTPVGSDWNAMATHQRATMPRVTKKPGAIIDPVSRMF
ncbi:hypothetical protein NliqN6_6091 [Naganishia liquefaciens]|uniref:U3 small nucleolar RNA-associated protein 14 n=1 Tax=Naganishia liquefaciens TaxID=104408 RepID=A0A8H3U0T1_9TREE|nr:hypothetical protein NliqN6_6091 [Naganishia liquefaciens]